MHVDFEGEVRPSLGRLLGVGGFGRVYAAMYRGTPAAVKIMACDGPQQFQVLAHTSSPLP
jgi:hypothetical protein